MSECPVPIIVWVPVSQVSIKNNLHVYYKAVVCDSHSTDSESLGHICSHLSRIKRLNLYNSVYREQQRNRKNLQILSQRRHMWNSRSRTGFSPRCARTLAVRACRALLGPWWFLPLITSPRTSKLSWNTPQTSRQRLETEEVFLVGALHLNRKKLLEFRTGKLTIKRVQKVN